MQVLESELGLFCVNKNAFQKKKTDQQHLLLRCSLFIVIMEASKHYTYPRTPHVSGSAVVDDDAR